MEHVNYLTQTIGSRHAASYENRHLTVKYLEEQLQRIKVSMEQNGNSTGRFTWEKRKLAGSTHMKSRGRFSVIKS